MFYIQSPALAFKNNYSISTLSLDPNSVVAATVTSLHAEAEVLK
jgi:hypothetical protein